MTDEELERDSAKLFFKDRKVAPALNEQTKKDILQYVSDWLDNLEGDKLHSSVHRELHLSFGINGATHRLQGDIKEISEPSNFGYGGNFKLHIVEDSNE